MKLSKDFLQINIKNSSINGYFTVALFTLFVVWFVLQPSVVTIEEIQNLIAAQDSRLAVFAVCFLIMLLCALTPLPAEVIALANTFIFSPWEAFFVTWVSAVICAGIAYEFGRLNSYDPCKYNPDGKVCQLLNRYQYRGLIMMRLVPVVPFFALNICGGIFKLDRFKFTAITAVTILPAVALLTFSPHYFVN